MNPRRDVKEANEGRRKQHALVMAVLAKLDHRAHLRTLAGEILEGTRIAAFDERPFVGEMQDFGTWCNAPDRDYQCPASGFSCTKLCSDFGSGKGFDCFNSYDDCAGSATTYSCSYTCGSGGTEGGYFDCGDYECDGFACSEEYDYNCTGTTFDCTSFDCTSGHVFLCAQSHDCSDTHYCSAGGTPCPTQYNAGAPGDFLCGWDEVTGGYDCPDEFNCNSDSEFTCSTVGPFECGGASAGSDTFSCGMSASTDFDCDGSYTCHDVFTCTGEYDCYYDCTDRFHCDDDFDCTGAFDCNSTYSCHTSFSCYEDYTCSVYECVSAFDCDSHFYCAPPFECGSGYSC